MPSCPKTQTNSRPAHRAVDEFIHHHYRERNHQGLGNALTEAEECVGSPVVSNNTNEPKTCATGRFGLEVSRLGWQWELE